MIDILAAGMTAVIISAGIVLSVGSMMALSGMVGAYAIFLLYTLRGWPFPVAVLGAMGVVIGVGVITELAFFRHLRGNQANTFMASTGLIFVLQVLAGQLWGLGRSKPVAPPLSLS